MSTQVNLQELEEKYGADLVKELKENIEYCEENKLLFKFEVLDETLHFIDFAFATRSYSYIYEISKNRKKISEKTFIGWKEANLVAKLMNSVNKA